MEPFVSSHQKEIDELADKALEKAAAVAKDLYKERYIKMSLTKSINYVYLSGPVSQFGDSDKWKDNFDKMYKAMLKIKLNDVNDINYIPINPMEYAEEIESKYEYGIDYNYIDRMHLWYAILDKCQAICVNVTDNAYLKSKGTLCELSYALGKGFAIYFADIKDDHIIITNNYTDTIETVYV